MEPLGIILMIVGALVLAAVMFAVGMVYRKRVGEREIGSAEAEATRIINEAIRSGESRKKEMLLEAKDEIHRSRTEHDKEVKERRAELSKQERRLQQKEESLDKKTDAFERKEEELASRMAEVTQLQHQAEEVKKQVTASAACHTCVTCAVYVNLFTVGYNGVRTLEYNYDAKLFCYGFCKQNSV